MLQLVKLCTLLKGSIFMEEDSLPCSKALQHCAAFSIDKDDPNNKIFVIRSDFFFFTELITVDI